jgi:hypothetical protein
MSRLKRMQSKCRLRTLRLGALGSIKEKAWFRFSKSGLALLMRPCSGSIMATMRSGMANGSWSAIRLDLRNESRMESSRTDRGSTISPFNIPTKCGR